MSPFGSRSVKGNSSTRGEATEGSRVVRLIDPKAEAVPVSIDIGDGGIIYRVGFRSAWMARHRWPPSDRQPRFARSV